MYSNPTMEGDSSNYNSLYVCEYNGNIEVNGTFNTKVIKRGKNGDIDYFDTTPLITILTDPHAKYSQNNSEKITVTGECSGELFLIQIDLVSESISIHNTSYTIINNLKKIYLPQTLHPIYQYTENPCILIIALFLIACNSESEESAFKQLALCEKIGKDVTVDKNYCLDVSSVLILSIYCQCTWLPKSDCIKYISDIIDEVNLQLGGLKSQHKEYLSAYNQYNMSAPHLEADIKKKETYRKKNSQLYSTITKLDVDDILELHIGCKSYFIIIKKNTYMTFTIDEFNTVSYHRIDPMTILKYQCTANQWNILYPKFAEYANKLLEEEKKQKDAIYNFSDNNMDLWNSYEQSQYQKGIYDST